MNIEEIKKLYNSIGIHALRENEIVKLINAIISERDTLKQQNAELAAYVEFFTSAISERFTSKESQPDGTVITDGAPWALTLLRATPAQCLLEVKAEAGRAGFIACVTHYEIDDAQSCIDEAADQYSNKIRRGE